ncbi:MAG TPA: 5'/3'-nucleotidase SurE [Vicinamibacterales bacterium]|nr:5'/3'-nucleotidase SurE [Vicinamibacterales bacterium]
MRQILVTNDDGHFSPGIAALARALGSLGRVTVVAPQTEASAVGHALTLRRPLRLEQVGERIYAVDGTPTDCVNIAIDKVLDARPDLVVSGINKGLNVGDDVTYSGTVAGALEGALLGYPAIAVSLQATSDAWDFEPAAAVALALAERLLARPMAPRTFLNVNVPQGPLRGVRVTVQARRNHITHVDRRLDPRQRPYFWIDEAMDEWEPHDRSDRQAIADGFVSVTPLQPDLTDHQALGPVERLADGLAATLFAKAGGTT